MRQYLPHSLGGISYWLVIMLALASMVTAETVEVEIFRKEYIPQKLTINRGDTVRWVNKERRQYHSVWFKELGEEDGEYFWPEEVFERTFDVVGTFAYRCGPHPKMTAVIHVRSDSVPPDSPTP